MQRGQRSRISEPKRSPDNLRTHVKSIKLYNFPFQRLGWALFREKVYQLTMMLTYHFEQNSIQTRESSRTFHFRLQYSYNAPEQTEFTDDETFEPLAGSSTVPYEKRCAKIRLESRDKLMYIRQVNISHSIFSFFSIFLFLCLLIFILAP